MQACKQLSSPWQYQALEDGKGKIRTYDELNQQIYSLSLLTTQPLSHFKEMHAFYRSRTCDIQLRKLLLYPTELKMLLYRKD
jgi:hypothetical protein